MSRSIRRVAASRKLFLEVLEDRIVLNGPNLIVNGNFELGNTGFTSNYTHSPSSIGPEGTYAVVTNPRNVHGGAASYTDHTSGTGRMMAVNGAPGTITVWEQTVAVTPNLNYQFSIYLSNWAGGGIAPAILQLSINGVTINPPGADFLAPSTNGTWKHVSLTWNAGAATTADIRFVNLNTVALGNDFALDDITFQQVDPAVTISPVNGAVVEAGTSGTYTVVLGSQPAADVVVSLSTDAQVTASAAQLTFNFQTWDTPQTVTVSAVDDTVIEGPHVGIITHSVTGGDPLYVGLAVSSVTANVGDNDTIPGISLVQSGGGAAVTEGGTTDTYTIVLDSAPSASVFITLAPNSQLTVAPATTLTFTTTNWNSAQTVTVAAADDALIEGSHNGVITYTISSADSVYNAITIPNLTAAITDNDFAGVTLTQTGGTAAVGEGGTTDTYTLVLNAMPSASVVIALSAASQVTVVPTTLTFTTLNWNTAQTVTVSAIDDSVAEGSHQGIVNHTASSGDTNYSVLTIPAVTAAITDNDTAGVTFAETSGSTSVSEAGLTDTYTAVLNTRPTATVILTVNPGTQLGVVSNRLTFTTANWSTPQTVTVSANDDAVAEGPHTGVLAHSIGSSDSFYASLILPSIIAAIADNDVAGVTIIPSGGGIDVTEGGATDTYAVVLNTQPAAPVVISFSPGTQLAVAPAPLSFTSLNWNVAVIVTVSAVDDTIFEGAHGGVISHAAVSTDGAYGGIGIVPVTAVIADNDSAPAVLITDDAIAVLEGTAHSYSISLAAPPTADVVINFFPDNQVSLSASSLIFSPTTWATPQPVVLSGVIDGIIEGADVGIVTHSATSADPAYNGVSVPSISAHIVDNDGVNVTATDGADTIIVSFTPQNVSVSIGGKVTLLPAAQGQVVILAGAGNDRITVNNPTVPVVIQGGGGNDSVFVNGLKSANAFTLDASSLAVNNVEVGLWNVENLVAIGSTASDAFSVANVPAFATEFQAGSGTDRVTGPNRANTWAINSSGGAVLDQNVKLTAVENLTGGPSSDTFAFSPAKSIGVINGGGGNDTLDYSLCTTPVTVNLQTAAATATKGFQGITRFVAGKGGADKLIGANQLNAWSITATNAGSVSGRSFQNFENLTGGSQNDVFSLVDGQGVKGKIDGGGGSDRLDYSNYSRAVSVNLQTSAATNTAGFLNLEGFQGGFGTDTLFGANKSNLWSLTGSGTGKVNAVTFGNFENLTGGSLADAFTLTSSLSDWLGTLNGGKGLDILTAFPGGNYVNSNTTTGTLNGHKFVDIENRR